MDLKEKEDILTVKDLAVYLKIKPITVYKYVSIGKIPGFKVGASWRFKKDTVDRWIKDREKVVSELSKEENALANA